MDTTPRHLYFSIPAIEDNEKQKRMISFLPTYLIHVSNKSKGKNYRSRPTRDRKTHNIYFPNLPKKHRRMKSINVSLSLFSQFCHMKNKRLGSTSLSLSSSCHRNEKHNRRNIIFSLLPQLQKHRTE